MPVSANPAEASAVDGASAASVIPAAEMTPEARRSGTAPTRFRTASPQNRIAAMLAENSAKAIPDSATPAPWSDDKYSALQSSTALSGTKDRRAISPIR